MQRTLTTQTPVDQHEFLDLIPPYFELRALAKARANEYRNNKPFPHICLDNFLPEQTANACLKAFPSPDSKVWMRTDISQEKKLSVSEERSIPSPIIDVLHALNGASFLSFLEELTGIEDLIPDPYLNGGGLHQIVPGGKLGVHVDFNKHAKFKLERRLNLLIYLNKGWKDEYGGHFEMWESPKTGKVKAFSPLFNRCVIFSTDEKSYHGHPHPLQAPKGESRKSLALYYYTNGRPKASRAYIHGTVFVEQESVAKKKFSLASVKKFVRAVTPPFVYELLKKVMARFGFDQ